jgi:flavin-dependent dehydrogenase
MAADGVTSNTLKYLKWPKFTPKDLVLTITKEIKVGKSQIVQELGSDKVHLYFGIKNLMTMGYAWLFPKEDTITVGWGNNLSKIKNTKSEFDRFISLPYVNQAIKNGSEEIFKPYLIPVNTRSQLYSDNVFAIGDAGGLVDPISGKGIPYAMLSGQIALQTLSRCEKKGTLEKLGEKYQKNLDKKFLNILRQKVVAREKIFESEENLKKFLNLWQNHRSSEIIMKKLL